MSEQTSTSDIRAGHWLDRLLPASALPYARLLRLDRPIGVWLLLLPCWWGLALAGGAGSRTLPLALLFAIGALVMRGAGCIVNDLWDRELDARVARTADRPLASGAITPRQALAVLAGLLALGLLILLQFEPGVILLGAASLPLIALYPLAKRVTHWPQLVLGFTFNWGALLGWIAARGWVETSAVVLYLAGVAWTLFYDTIYAHQDKADDAKLGVRSTALLFGAHTRAWLIGFALATLTLLAAATSLAGLRWPVLLGLAGAALHLAWQLAKLDLDAPASCLATFRANRDFGLIVLLALIAGSLV
ncbi:MAG: 4-hydroxybenzoate octaprenyltransferase [Alphaproteobacteria bacterium]|nr:4-hydroxybenzoate octaprenyltransferase [Alphaproteobacteria bacterium]